MKPLLLPVLLFWGLALSAQPGRMLVKNHASAYSIVLGPAAGPQDQKAAAILQQYLQKISGARLPINGDSAVPQATEIVIGLTNRPAPAGWKEILSRLGEDGYYLKTDKGRLFIGGGSGKGTVNGVVSLLEDYLGCRRYSPEVESVPQSPDITLADLDDRQVPPAAIRIINSEFLNNESYKDWRKLETVADKWNDGHWGGYYVHTLGRLVPPQQYFESHPEYYSLVGGRRIPFGQICLSNPAVFDIVVNRLKLEMEAHPEVQYWSVSQNDNYDYCQCDSCTRQNEAEQSPMGSVLRFVNRVAAQFPGKTITTLAYQYSRKPPALTRPAPNVLITLCTIELNRSRPIETDPGSESFKNDIIGWSRICQNIMIWDYEVQFTNYLCPFPLFHTLQPNIEFFTRYGVKAHFQQCNAVHGGEFSELKTYLISKLLWNPAANVPAIIADFMNGYYKAAGPYIHAYFDLLQQEGIRSGQGLDIYGTPVWNAGTFLSQANIDRYNALFDQAEQAVAAEPEVLQRVRVARLSLQFADMEIAKTDMFGPRGWYEIRGGRYLLRPERMKLLNDFHQTCLANGIVQMNENGLTAEAYYNNTLRFIDVQVEGNLAFQKPVSCDPLPNEKYSGLGPSLLTNGVRGTDDYKINWLGWEGQDVSISIDLQKSTALQEVNLSSLQFPKSWILHPLGVACWVSEDGKSYLKKGELVQEAALPEDPLVKNFRFPMQGIHARYLKLVVTATRVLPPWHAYKGNKSWLFIDEIVVK